MTLTRERSHFVRMGYTMYNAEWLIEAQKPDGTLIEQLAYCKSFACAEAAFDAAVRTRPYEHIVFRHGARLLRKHKGKWTAKRMTDDEEGKTR